MKAKRIRKVATALMFGQAAQALALPADYVPNLNSVPGTAVNWEIEGQVAANIKLERGVARHDCFVLFPDHETITYVENNSYATYGSTELARRLRCFLNPAFSYVTDTRHFSLMGGLKTDTRADYNDMASDFGLTLNQSTLDLYIAMHEYKHYMDFFKPQDKSNPQQEFLGDIYAQLVLHAFKPEGYEDMIEFFARRRKAMENNPGNRGDKYHPLLMDVTPYARDLPRDINALSALADRIYAFSPVSRPGYRPKP